MMKRLKCTVKGCNREVWWQDKKGKFYCNHHYIRAYGTQADKLEPNKYVGPTEYKRNSTLLTTPAPVVKHELKTVPAYLEFKYSENGEDLGIVDHLISVYGVTDLGNDIAHSGMFTKTITERQKHIRVVDNHQMHSVNNVIGVPLKLWEVGREGLPTKVLEDYPDATGGLMAQTQFLMDTPEGKGAYIRIKSGAISEFSFAYDALDYDFEEKEERKKVRNLRTVRLWEYGPVIFGMNPAAQAVGSKSTDVLDQLGVRLLMEEVDHVILYNDETKLYYRANFEEVENKRIYEDEADWKAGSLEFVPIPTDEELEEEEQATRLKTKIIELELEFMEVLGLAGPE